MKNRTPKIKILLATRYFLSRLGLKSALGLTGVDVEIIEEHAPEQVLQSLKNANDIHYYILCEDIYIVDRTLFTEAIKNCNPEKQVMLIGENLFSKNEPILHLPKTASKEEVSEGFNKLFISFENQEGDEGNILTEREIEVLRNVALGFANKEIADRLFISINTVITHRKNITEKLEIKTIAGLTVYAIMNKIIAPNEVKF